MINMGNNCQFKELELPIRNFTWRFTIFYELIWSLHNTVYTIATFKMNIIELCYQNRITWAIRKIRKFVKSQYVCIRE